MSIPILTSEEHAHLRRARAIVDHLLHKEARRAAEDRQWGDPLDGCSAVLSKLVNSTDPHLDANPLSDPLCNFLLTENAREVSTLQESVVLEVVRREFVCKYDNETIQQADWFQIASAIAAGVVAALRGEP